MKSCQNPILFGKVCDKSQLGSPVQLSKVSIIATFCAALMFCVATCAVAQTPRGHTPGKAAPVRVKATGVADFTKDGICLLYTSDAADE